MISIRTDANALKIQHNLSNVTDRLVYATKRLTTGEKITQAKDDAAGLYISSGLSTRINALSVGISATQTGTSILNIAEGSITSMINSLSRVRDLAVEASNSYYTPDARSAMQSEADSLIEEIYREKEGCNFNGKKLFNAVKPDIESVSTVSGGGRIYHYTAYT